MTLRNDLLNPYWDIVKELPGEGIARDLQKIWRPDPWQLYRVHEGNTEEYLSFSQDGPTRQNLVTRYAWAIPSPESIDWIISYLNGRPVVEVGAGTGYWAWLLSQAGVDVNAYDIKPPGKGWNEYHCPREEQLVVYTDEERREHEEHWHEMRRLGFWESTDEYEPLPVASEREVTYGAAGLEWHPVHEGGVEVLGLPENQERVLFLCWPPYEGDLASDALDAYQGDALIYIGEGQGGCTATDAFFQKLDRDWKPCAEGPLVQWGALHDHLEVWIR